MRIIEFAIPDVSFAMFAMRMPFMSHDKSTEESDIDLAVKLKNAGREHRKFLRQLNINMYMEASMAFWFEFDTYKVGVTSNSESFWNTITKRGQFDIYDFVIPNVNTNEYANMYCALNQILTIINNHWKETGCKKEMLRYLVPQGIKYRRCISLNGEALLNIIEQRKNHRLKEWQDFVLSVENYINTYHKNLYPIFFGENVGDINV